MSASVLAGNSPLSATPPRADSTRATSSEASGGSTFQLAVGSAGEEGRRTTGRQPSPSTEEMKEPVRHPAKGNEKGQRLQMWMSGMESQPVAGDLLLSGGALTPENGQPPAIVEDGSLNRPENDEPDVLASVERDVRRLVALSVQTSETAEASVTAEATAPLEVPESAEVPGTKEVREPLTLSRVDGANDKGIQVLDSGTDQAHSDVDNSTGHTSNAKSIAEPVDHADPESVAEPQVEESSKPTPVDEQPVQTVSTTVSLLTQPQIHPADSRIARNTESVGSNFGQPRLNPDEARDPQMGGTEPATSAKQALESVSGSKPDASPVIRDPQPVTVIPTRQPDAPAVAQTFAMMPKPFIGSAKADVARDRDGAAERTDLNPRIGAARDVNGLERPRVDAVERQQPARPMNSEQRPTPVDPGSQTIANARDTAPTQTAASQVQPPTVTVVESRQYLGVTPQQANAEAISKAVSGNEAWSAVLRNEATIQTSSPLQTLKIRLNPAELGMVDATLRLSGDKLVVELNVQTTEAYRQLSDNRQNVLNALRGQSYGVETLSVQLSPSDRSGQQGTSTGQQQGGFDGQPTQDNFRQSGEGGRSGQEHRNDDGHRFDTAGRGEPSTDGSTVPPGNADGAVYL